MDILSFLTSPDGARILANAGAAMTAASNTPASRLPQAHQNPWIAGLQGAYAGEQQNVAQHKADAAAALAAQKQQAAIQAQNFDTLQKIQAYNMKARMLGMPEIQLPNGATAATVASTQSSTPSVPAAAPGIPAGFSGPTVAAANALPNGAGNALVSPSQPATGALPGAGVPTGATGVASAPQGANHPMFDMGTIRRVISGQEQPTAQTARMVSSYYALTGDTNSATQWNTEANNLDYNQQAGAAAAKLGMTVGPDGKMQYAPGYLEGLKQRTAITGKKGSNVNVTMGKQNPFGNLIFGAKGDYNNIMTSADRSVAVMPTVEQSIDLMKTGTPTGSINNLILPVKGYLKDAGINIKDYSNQQMLNAYAYQVAIPNVKKLGVNPTDKDMENTLKQTFGLEKDEITNAKMLAAMKVENQYNIDLKDYVSGKLEEAQNKGIPQEKWSFIEQNAKTKFRNTFLSRYNKMFKNTVNDIALYYKPVNKMTESEIKQLDPTKLSTDKLVALKQRLQSMNSKNGSQ